MRHILVSGLIVLVTATSASALDRYPTTKRYVNQTGQVITVGQTSPIAAYAPVRRALPPVQIVPIQASPIVEVLPQARPTPRLVAAKSSDRGGLFGPINVNPSDWPSGRKCCRPGEPYFNEEPHS